MWVVLGVFYGLVCWVAAMLYAMIAGGSILITTLVCPFIVSGVTIIVCAVGLMSEAVKSWRKAS